MRFTANAVNIGGQSMQFSFEVDGLRVKVIAEGQAVSMTFLMLDKDTTVMDLVLVKMSTTALSSRTLQSNPSSNMSYEYRSDQAQLVFPPLARREHAELPWAVLVSC